MNACQNCETLLSAFLPDALGEEDLRGLEQHLESCATCRRRAAEMFRTERALAELGAESVREKMTSRIRAALAAESPADSAPAQHGDVKFWFCEKCGKRLSDRDIAAGDARDKKLKGVYCADCAVGVLTMANLPVINEDTARKLLAKEKAEPQTAPAQPVAQDDSGLRPDVKFATGIQKAVKGRKSSARLRPGSARRLPAAGRKAGGWPAWLPTLAAASILVVVAVYMTVIRGSGLNTSPTPAAEDPKVREALAKKRKAEEDLARAQAEKKKAEEQARLAEAKRKQSQERLAEIERERQALAAAQAQQQSEAEAEAHKQALAKLEAARQAEAARMAQAELDKQKAEAEQARAEAERKTAEQRVAEGKKQAEDIGHIVFVVELTKGDEKAQPVLVRNGGERQPLAVGMKLQKGDKIQTGAVAATQPAGAPAAPRPVHAAVDLGGGAVVDLADGTLFELVDKHIAKLEMGQLYAEISDAGVGTDFILKTAFADVTTRAASLELRADAKEALLLLDEGEAHFANALGARTLKKLQQSIARKDYAPGPAQVLGSAFARLDRKSARETVLFRDSFEDLKAWGRDSIGISGVLSELVPHTFEKVAAKSGAQGLRIRYVFQKLPERSQTIQRPVQVPAEATRIRLWVKVNAASKDAQLKLTLENSKQGVWWSQLAADNSSRRDWQCIELDLSKGWTSYDRTKGRGTEPPPNMQAITHISLATSGLELDVCVDDVEFFQRAAPREK